VLCVVIQDKHEFSKIVESVKTSFNDNADHTRKWGGGIMGVKSQHQMKIRQKVIEKENRGR